MVRYYKYQNNSNIESVKGKWFLRVKNGETIDIDQLAAHMASHSTAYTEGEIAGMCKDIVNEIQELVLDGKQVKLANLAIFSLGVRCIGADNPDNATVQNIRNIHINARGTGKFSSAQLRQKCKFKEMDEYNR